MSSDLLSAADRPAAAGLPVPPQAFVGHPRVVYFAMKPQLRGRIRRNVATLLDLGADVTVLTVRSNKDFFVGLEHPRLRAEYFEARSLYVRLAQHTSRRSLEQAKRRQARAATGHGPTSGARRLLLAPVYLVVALLSPLRLLAPVFGWVRRAGSAVLRLLSRIAAWAWRRLPLRVRRLAWLLARWLVRARKRAQRAWRRRVVPAARALLHHAWAPVTAAARRLRSTLSRQKPTPVRRSWGLPRSWRLRRLLLARAVLRHRRTIQRGLLNRRLRLSRAVFGHARNALRPWHRTSRFFAFWRESAERGAELAPDLVVSSDLPGLVGAGRVARRLRVPHLHDCHELYLESTSFRGVERRLLAPMERRYFRRADSVVAVNQSIASEYARRYGREPVVVRNCAPRLTDDLEVKDLRTLCGLPEASRIVLYQGGFSAGRGLDVCVAAVADLPADVHLVLLGFGPLREELTLWAHAHGVADRVHVLDAVPPEELASCTVSATVGLMPYQPVSRNNLLALPNKIFEYTAVGVPIVVSDLPELRRIAVGQGCGEVYDPFDAASLAAALRRVLDPAEYPRHLEAARAFGRSNVWETEREILIGQLLSVAPPRANDADRRREAS